jgi:hypothetical protein
LFSIPVINGMNRYINCLWIFFPISQWTQWCPVMIRRILLHNSLV